jgi:hypothetical protein
MRRADGRTGRRAVAPLSGGLRCARLVVAAGLLLPVCPPARLPAQSAQTSLTIYNDGRVLVRRTLAIAVPKGASEQRLALGPLDPATLFALDSGVTVAGARYDGADAETSAMRRAVGRPILFRIGADTLSATVIGLDPERFRVADGRIIFGRPGQPVFSEDLVVPGPASQVSVRSDAPRKALRLGYFTSGAQWQASYQAILGRGTARLTGSAVLASETLRAEDAEIQLLAGNVNRGGPSPRVLMEAVVTAKAPAAGFEVPQERVGEFHVYTLPGRTTIEPGTTTAVGLFEPATVPFERAYVVRGQLPYYGFIPQQGDENQVPVEVGYTLKHARKMDFGERPIPGGVVRLFQPDSAGRLQLVGEAAIGHTAAGEDVRVAAGTAFDLTARRAQTNYAIRRDSIGTRWRTGATVDYRVTLANATDSAVTIEVREERGGEWSVLSSSVPAEKLSATLTRFRVAVPGRGEATLTYRIRAVW